MAKLLRMPITPDPAPTPPYDRAENIRARKRGIVAFTIIGILLVVMVWSQVARAKGVETAIVTIAIMVPAMIWAGRHFVFGYDIKPSLEVYNVYNELGTNAILRYYDPEEGEDGGIVHYQVRDYHTLNRHLDRLIERGVITYEDAMLMTDEMGKLKYLACPRLRNKHSQIPKIPEGPKRGLDRTLSLM